MIVTAVICFVSGFVVHALVVVLFDRMMNRPQVPKMPKDYRKICGCIE